MPKHRVMRPTTAWFSVLVASLGLVVGGILLALTAPSAAADPGSSPVVTVTSGSDETPPTNSGNGAADHPAGVTVTETSRVPARSVTGPTPDLGQGDGNNGNGNNGNGDGNSGTPGNSGNDGDEGGGPATVPTTEPPGIGLPAITIPALPIPGPPILGLPTPGLPAPNGSTPPAPGSPTPSTGAPESTPGESEPLVPEGQPLSDPNTSPGATPAASNCLMGAGTGGGCAGAEVARDLSPAGLLVLGSVALFGSGAFLESLRNGRG